MKKKYIVAGITCIFILISGILYSCSYKKTPTSFVTSLSSEQSGGNGQVESKALDKNTVQADADNEEMVQTRNEMLPTATNEEAVKNSIAQEADSNIYVHICGAVNQPGVYWAEVGARVYDFIQLAGGFKVDAASDYMNLARQVSDGERIYIPSKEEIKVLSVEDYISGDPGASEVAQTSSDNSSENKQGELLNINSAGLEELMNLPGIGQAKANSILNYRSESGDFKSIEELMNIPGIKQGLFNKISSYIKVE